MTLTAQELMAELRGEDDSMPIFFCDSDGERIPLQVCYSSDKYGNTIMLLERGPED